MGISHCSPKLLSQNNLLLPLTIRCPELAAGTSCVGVGSANFVHLGEEEKWVLARVCQLWWEDAEKP